MLLIGARQSTSETVSKLVVQQEATEHRKQEQSEIRLNLSFVLRICSVTPEEQEDESQSVVVDSRESKFSRHDVFWT